MNAEQIEELFKTSDRLVGAVSTDFHRYLEVDWRDRLICIAGARGTGKTTMLRQRMKETFGVGSNQAIYISLDDLYFSQYRVRRRQVDVRGRRQGQDLQADRGCPEQLCRKR